jgi:hypothetical protein
MNGVKMVGLHVRMDRVKMVDLPVRMNRVKMVDLPVRMNRVKMVGLPVRMNSRVFSKQTKKFFGSNRNKPKLNLFRLIFGLFRKAKKFLFRFVSVRFGIFNKFRNNQKNRNKQICFETNRKKNKKSNVKTRVSTKKQDKFRVRTEKKRNSSVLVDFRFVSRNQTKIFGSVRFGVSNPY